MPAPSLIQLARKACIKNINSITDIGDAEYSLVRPILLKLQNPKQLHQIEQNSPQIIGADAEIWRELCKRDVANYEKNPQEPSNPRSWYKCYLKLYKAGQKEIDADAAMLKATMDGIKTKQAQNTAQQVELRGVKGPTGLRRNLPQITLPQASSLYQEMGQKKEYSRDTVERAPPKAVSTLAKIKRATVAQSHFAGAKKLQGGIIRPIPTKTAIVAPPRQLVEEHQKAKIREPIDPTLQPAAVFNPRKRRIEHVDTAATSDREAREKRLRALTNPSRTPAPISSNLTPSPQPTISHPPRADSTVRAELAKLNSPQRSSSHARLAPNDPSPARPSSRTGTSPGPTISRANTSSPQIRPPMRIRRAPANPMVTPKRRPVS